MFTEMNAADFVTLLSTILLAIFATYLIIGLYESL